MSLPDFTQRASDGPLDLRSEYTLHPTDEVRAEGTVLVELSEQIMQTDDHHESRPMVVFQFCGLTVGGRWMAAPAAAVAFRPAWSGHEPGTPTLVLGESGRLVTDLGRLLGNQPQHIQDAMDRVLQAIAMHFLTDMRVAHFRHDAANRRLQRAVHTHDLAAMRMHAATLRLARARTEVNTAAALVQAVRDHIEL
ncbi:hypothetical protein GPX89_25675 [Nocardia sp. ET3-3]|uniref:Uncharacterized protein n=1 Tax=Nocardia terrae TaxID=2675851 RepID=A0A7K1V280_9NOCA|nr:hypothetical protein [Nocardia terrae]MVU80627.1 hypothetical protein [Nocardia terrae]